MALGEGVHLLRAEIRRQHGAAKRYHLAQRQQGGLNHRKIAVAADQQRVRLLPCDERLPVNALQQTTGAVTAANRHHNGIGRHQAGEAVNIRQTLGV